MRYLTREEILAEATAARAEETAARARLAAVEVTAQAEFNETGGGCSTQTMRRLDDARDNVKRAEEASWMATEAAEE